MLSSAKEPFSRAEVKPGVPALSSSGLFVELAVSDSKWKGSARKEGVFAARSAGYFAISQRVRATNIVTRRKLLAKR